MERHASGGDCQRFRGVRPYVANEHRCRKKSERRHKMLGCFGRRASPQKKRPRQCRGPIFKFLVRVRPAHHRCRCRRRPGNAKTNPCQISCRYCPRRTVNGAYTLIDMVNRVLTINSLPIWQLRRGGCRRGGRGWRAGRQLAVVCQADSPGRYRSQAGRGAPSSAHLRCLRRLRWRPDGGRDRWSI